MRCECIAHSSRDLTGKTNLNTPLVNSKETRTAKNSRMLLRIKNWFQQFFFFLYILDSQLIFVSCSFLAQTGLVTVENQMKEIGLAPKIDVDKSQ